MASYTTTLDVCVPAPVLYQWLADVTLHERYLPDLTVADVRTAGAALSAGASWRESRRGLLFLRDWAHVQCTTADPAAGSFTLVLDDGYNRVVTNYAVVPLGMAAARVTQEVSCSTRASGDLAPSPKLAGYMARQDCRLQRLRDHLEAMGRALGGTAAAQQRSECAQFNAMPMVAV